MNQHLLPSKPPSQQAAHRVFFGKPDPSGNAMLTVQRPQLGAIGPVGDPRTKPSEGKTKSIEKRSGCQSPAGMTFRRQSETRPVSKIVTVSQSGVNEMPCERQRAARNLTENTG
ncbi:hypothetical protein SV7mr_34570 [Stieleria bergensis]|uniref:Uncharacterized protein n=1 Tax=Stieleria bergensis TaxID=2528025 RepID=A0A517SXP9_9BACT|nr:hypothetical protein SV7mr_34570 [Planctomycetes bacterium SV_7m_r]